MEDGFQKGDSHDLPKGFREDLRNSSRLVKPLNYGAYGSYAPSYDSTFASMTKEESAFVLSTYQNDYSEAVLDFIKTYDYEEHLPDSLLKILTGEEPEKDSEEVIEIKEDKKKETTLEDVKIDVDGLKSLDKLGIDVNFLDDMREEIQQAEQVIELQQKLNSMGQMLQKLQQTQYERLSQPPPAILNRVASKEEYSIAEQCVNELTSLSKKVTPASISSIPAIRKALGAMKPKVPKVVPEKMDISQ